MTSFRMKMAKFLGRTFLGKASLFVVRQTRLIADPHRFKVVNKKTFSQTLSLRPCHVQLCSVKATREDLLDLVPRGAVCAEVGVAAGFFSRIILERVQPRKLYLIEYSGDACRNLRKTFSKEIDDKQVEVLEGDSTTVLQRFPDASLDFCYLDAQHDYEHPARELKICRVKVKLGGLIAGHDYTRFSVWEQQQYGVIEAVNEFVVRENLKLVGVSLDLLTSNMSFCIENSECMDQGT